MVLRGTRPAEEARMPASTVLLREEIVAEAQARHAQYPQYEGHWTGDEWVVVRVTKTIRTKMGVAFEQGDLSIARRETRTERVAPRGAFLPYEQWPEKEFATVYSRRNGIDTSVPARHVERVA